MKQLMFLISGMMLAAASAFASNVENLAAMEFYTSGPDTYTDGSAVVPGETYLFVYVKPGATFGGVNTQGELLDKDNNAIVGSAQAFVDSKGNIRCPFTQFSYQPSEYPGTFCIVLLDTRVSTTAVGGFVDAYQATVATAAGGTISRTVASADAAGNAIGGATAAGAVTKSLLNAETDIPTLSGIKTDANGNTVLEVENVRGFGAYAVEATDTLGDWSKADNAGTIKNVEGKATVTVPASTTKVRFFKVIGK